VTRIVLVRHGQTEWNRVERFRGRADVPLNETGVRQAEMTAGRIAATWKPSAIYAGPLSRTMETAKAIASRWELHVDISANLIDIDFGQWQGLTPDQVREKWPEQLSAWYKAPHTVRIPGGEALEEVRERCARVLRELPARHRDATVVLVSHMDINRTLLLIALGLGNESLRRLRQDNCAINELEMNDDELVVVSMNDTAHLAQVPQAQ
jgi:broad specificity phosphatase PhoE